MTSHSVSSLETPFERQARQLFVRINSGHALPEDHESAARWRAQSADHEQAFRQMEQTWQLLGSLGSSAADANERIEERRGSKQPWFGAVAAALVGIAVCGWLIGPASGVASDAQRPSHGTAGPADIRVTGTSFNVQHLGESVVLTVSDGRVIASTADGTKKIALTAGQTLTWGDDGKSEPGLVMLTPRGSL